MPARMKDFAARLLPCCGDATLWRCSISSACTPFLEGDEALGPKTSGQSKPVAESRAAGKAASAAAIEQLQQCSNPELAASQGKNNLAVLPPELLHHIFSFMGLRDIASTRLVCREWREMATATVHTLRPRFCMSSRLGTAFPNLTQLDLSRTSGLMDRDIERLHGLPGLAVLSMVRCRRVTDVAVLTLAARNPDLTTLNLARCHSITGFAFEALETGQLSRLHKLNLKHCHRMTGESVAALSRLGSLQDLNVSKCWMVNDISLAGLAHLSQLTALRMNGCDQISDAGLAQVTQMRSLRMLKWRMPRELLASSESTGEGIIRLSHYLPGLTHLQLSLGSKVTPEAVASLTRLTSLQDLRLYCNCPVDDSSLQAWGALSQLSRLTVHAYERCLGTASLEHLKRLQQLQMLDVDALGDAEGSDLGHLTSLPKLCQLRVTRCLFWGPSLAALALQLTWLDLSHSPFVNSGLLEAVGKLRRLQALNLSGCKGLQDVLLLCLSGLHQLQHLCLSSCAGLDGHKLCILGPHLAALRALDLSFCNSLDSKVLPFAVAQFPALTHLNLSLCRSLQDSTALELSNSGQLEVLNISNSGLARGSMNALLDGPSWSIGDGPHAAPARCKVIQKRPEPDDFKPWRL
ncbi:hypothetical protein WJX74_009201 [Apatococcus lobatus]|uniref:F-box domain-containing protein n=1 Tax=Apatococcus lobatus TaxID=904363 RepID=A0AAW1RYB0_9CHLO